MKTLKKSENFKKICKKPEHHYPVCGVTRLCAMQPMHTPFPANDAK